MVALYLVGLAALLPCYILFATDRYTLLARILAWLGLGISLLPTLVMLIRPASRMNGIAAAGLLIAVFYHLAVFHERRLVLRWGEARISDTSVELALLLAAVATPAMWLGWFLAGTARIGRLLPKPELCVPPGLLRNAGCVLILLALGADLLWIRGELTTYQPAVSVISALLPLELGVAMLVVHQVRGHATARDRLLFWLLFTLIGTFSLARGMIMVIIRPFLLYLLGWVYIARRVRVLPVIAVLGAVLIMQPVKGEFRQRVWDRPVEMSLTDRALLYVDLLERHWLGGDFDPIIDRTRSVETAMARTGASLALANVIELTPGAVPHQWGATYKYLQYAFIPRVLYPDKPISQYADVWAAVMFGYTTERGTSHVMVGLSQIAESYINFGLLGGLFMLMVIGVLYRANDEIMGRREAGLGALSVYLYAVSNTMIGFDGSFAQTWGGIVQTLLLYGVAMKVLGSRLLRGGRTAL
jgi:hypothetical protein